MNGVVKRMVVAIILCLPMAVFSTISLKHALVRKVVVTSSTLPEIEGWQSEEVPLTEAERETLDSPGSCQRVYQDAAGDRVQILVLQINDTQNAHDPKLCMVGSGYANPEDRVIDAPWSSHVQQQQVSRALFTKLGSTVTMYYWIQTGDKTIADLSAGYKWEGIKRALTGSSIRGIAVRVMALPSANGQDTNPQVAVKLWETVSNRADMNRLVSQIG